MNNSTSKLLTAWIQVRNALVWMLALAPVPAFVALVGAVAGLWASIYANELKGAVIAFPNIGFSGPYSPEVKIGASLFVLFFLLFALQQSAKNFQEAEARRDLLDETNRLKALVERLETLPPDGFLQEVQNLYREIAYLPLMTWSDDTVRKEDLEAAIRTVLDAIANLAHKFDGELEAESYAANLMICRTRAQLDALPHDKRIALEDRMVFCPDLPSPKLNGVTAVLEL